MIAFWIAAALISAAAAGLILHRASRAAALAALGHEDPAMAVYRRQLEEVDDLAARGLIAPEDLRGVHAEAGRRLLAAADGPVAGLDEAATAQAGAKPRLRIVVLGCAALAPLAAAGVYLLIGSPQFPDQPYRARVAAWTKADPTLLDPARMAAVLQSVVAKNPGRPEPLVYLAKAQALSGDSFSAERTVQKALVITPKDPDLWTFYGELVASDQGGDLLPDDARQAFQKALAISPAAPAPRYYLARSRMAGGDLAGGLADWKALLDSLPPDDPRRVGLGQEIAQVERTHAPLGAATPTSGEPGPAAPAQVQAGQDQQAFIHAMVDRLAARLAAQPDDPAGWARLVRSYGVLGDSGHQAEALAKARMLFKARPSDLAPIEAAAAGGRP